MSEEMNSQLESTRNETIREIIKERNALRAKLELAKALLIRLSRCPVDMYIILSNEAVELLPQLEEK